MRSSSGWDDAEPVVEVLPEGARLMCLFRSCWTSDDDIQFNAFLAPTRMNSRPDHPEELGLDISQVVDLVEEKGPVIG